MTQHFAQTNIQLYNQMIKAGYPESDLHRITEAYKLAAKVFAGCYRRSGKNQQAHLIGTASIMAWLRRPSISIAAALLHAVYEEGNFGSRINFKELQNATCPEVQQLVAAYYKLKWSHDLKEVDNLIARVSNMNDFYREVVLLRVVNELEDYIDLAPHYHLGRKGDGSPTYLDDVSLRKFALALGQPRLAKEISAQSDAVRTAQIPASLHYTYPRFNPSDPYCLTIRGRWRQLLRNYRRIRKPGLIKIIQAVKRRLKND
ncbi:MAG: HD domain-containing protein [Nanoarchaeota archaeon]|nr:HD domain-containing protein [Nanoarchaeota archaeon]